MTGPGGAGILSAARAADQKGRPHSVDADPGRLALSELESMTVVDAAGAELGELLESISESCARASLAVASSYFGSVRSISWEAEEG